MIHFTTDAPSTVEPSDALTETCEECGRLLLQACQDAYQEQYEGRLLRPYLCIYEHDEHGPLLVAANLLYSNLAAEVVRSGCKYGSGGATETMDAYWAWVVGCELHDGPAMWRVRGVPLVEGAYGKYWFNIDGESGDLLEFFFVTQGGAIRSWPAVLAEGHRIVSGKELYHTHKKAVARNRPRFLEAVP